MIDFKVNRDFQFFGTDNPATAVVERIAFVVVTDRSVYNPDSDAGSVVNIGIAGAAARHATSPGITAGNGLFGGAMSGAAPGAQLMAVKVCLTTTSCTSSGLIDGVLYAAHNGADVVNISIGGLPALNDGNNARAELYNRTIDEFNMQIFISAGNSGAGRQHRRRPVGGHATRSASASSITDDTWLSNYGSDGRQRHGPAPVLLPRPARGRRVQAEHRRARARPSRPRRSGRRAARSPGPTRCRPGYSMFNGTSMAAPQATGAAALLVSAYKATHGGQRPDRGRAAQRDHVERRVPAEPRRLRAGRRPASRSARRGRC